jgi:transcriptional regulator with XRE-family HTH domain
MRVQAQRLKAICRDRGERLKDVLDAAGVSRTAYYSLTRKESVLPKSIQRLADCLDVSPLAFLEDGGAQVRRVRALRERTDAICREAPECDRDVVFRTLANLDRPPVERLRRALRRARETRLHR